MAGPLNASMPQFTELSSGATVTLEALDPTTGAAVTGVVFSNVDIWADASPAPGSTSTQVGPYLLVPGPGA